MVSPTAAQSLQNESTGSSSRNISSTAPKSSTSINAPAKAIPSPRAASGTGKTTPASISKSVPGPTGPVASSRPATGVVEPAAAPRQSARLTKRKQSEDEAGSAMATNASPGDERAKRARTSTEEAGSSKIRGPEDLNDIDAGAPMGEQTPQEKVREARAKHQALQRSRGANAWPPVRVSCTQVGDTPRRVGDASRRRPGRPASKPLPPSTSMSGTSQAPARPQKSGTATASKAQPSSTASPEEPASAELHLEAAQDQLEILRGELQTMRRWEREWRQAAEESASVLKKEREAHANLQVEAAALQKTVDEQLASLQARRQAAEESASVLKKEREAHANLKAETATLQKTVAEQLASLQAEREEGGKLRADLDASREARANLKAQAAALQDTVDEQLASLHAEREEGGKLRADLDASREAHANLKAEAAALQNTVDEQLASLHAESEEGGKLRADLDASRARAAALEADLKLQRAGADALYTALADAKSAKDELRCMKLERAEAQLGELSRSRDSLTSEHEQRQQELMHMKTALEEAENGRSRAEAQRREEAERAASVQALLARANEAYGELSDERVRAEEQGRDLERQLSEAKDECETVRQKLEADLAGKTVTQGVSEQDRARLVHLDALKRQNFKLVAKLEDIDTENRAHARSLKAVWDAGQALLASLGVSDSEPMPDEAYGDLEAMMRRLSEMKNLQLECSNMRTTLEKAKASLAEERKAKQQLCEAVLREREEVRDAAERVHRTEEAALEERLMVRRRCHRAELLLFEECELRHFGEEEFVGAFKFDSEPMPDAAFGDLEVMIRRLSEMKNLPLEYSNMRTTLEKAKASLAKEHKAKEQLRKAALQERVAMKIAAERCHWTEQAALDERAVVWERCHSAELLALVECARRLEAQQEAAKEQKRRADMELVVHEVGHAPTLAALVKM